MATTLHQLFARDHQDAEISQTIINLLIALLVLLVASICMCGALLLFRIRRRANKAHGLPMYNEKRDSASTMASYHRRTSGKPSESIYVLQEKQNLLDHSDEPRSNSIPEIRLTFPEEYDADGKRTSGRCVVVRVSESGVGLEPVQDKLPAYKSSEGERFQSLDLDRVGGLTEKEDQKQWS
ncbi:hypothetical protein Q7P37_011043 [Cladosporium fusiforme]